MLEGLEISEVVYSWILANNFDLRIDSEYFLKKYTHIDSVLSKVATKCTKEISSKITDGTHYTPDYQDTGYKFFSAINVSDNYFDADAGFKYISEKEHKQLYSRCNPMENDVLLRKVGVGDRKACVVPEMDEQFSIFVSVALIKCKLINPYYLSTFINSKYGQSQLLRFNKGIGQPDLHLEDIARCQIPMLNETFQTKIEQLVKVAHKIILQSKKKYAKAENLLIKELSLDSWQPSKEAITIKTFTHVQSSHRWDAEYYQPKYTKLFAQLDGINLVPLHKIVTIQKSIEPGSNMYEDSGIPFVRVSDMSKYGLSEPNVYLDAHVFKDVIRPKKDTILLSKDGSVGIAYKVQEDLNVITSGAILHLSIFNDDFLPDYVTLVLNSIVGEMQAERDAGGSIIQHWKSSEIENVLIPKLDKKIQQEILQLVQESFKLKTESKRLLEVAKRTVEIAIEENEETAIQYITEYGKSLYNK